MKPVAADPKLVAYCGLYCGACRRYLREKCPGCRENAGATWCKVRTCCAGEGLETCAACTGFPDVMRCKKFNNVLSRLFGFVFRSDRPACVARIKAVGCEAYATEMAARRAQSIRR